MSQAAANPSAHQQDPALSPLAYAGFVLALLGVWHVLTLWLGVMCYPALVKHWDVCGICCQRAA